MIGIVRSCELRVRNHRARLRPAGRPTSSWKRRALTELAAAKSALAVERTAAGRRRRRRTRATSGADFSARAVRVDHARTVRSWRKHRRVWGAVGCWAPSAVLSGWLGHHRSLLAAVRVEPLALVVVHTSHQSEDEDENDKAAHARHPCTARAATRPQALRHLHVGVTTQAARSVNRQLHCNLVLRSATSCRDPRRCMRPP